MLCNSHQMAVARTRSAGERTKKHRRAHRLVQTWVSPKMKKALDTLAKKAGRTIANFVRYELAKITGIPE